MRNTTFFQGLRVFLFGSKTEDTVVAALETGVPKRNTWYKAVNAAGAIVGHVFVCNCGTEYPLESWLLEEVKKSRVREACVKAGLSENPTPAELALAKELGKEIQVDDGEIHDDEIQSAYRRMTHRSPNAFRMTRPGGPQVLDVNGPKLNGGKEATGEVIYEPWNPDGAPRDDNGNQIQTTPAFNDPMNASFGRSRFETPEERAKNIAANAARVEARTLRLYGTPEQQAERREQERLDDESYAKKMKELRMARRG